MDTASLQGDAQRFRVHADLGRALLERLAGGVQLSSVRELRRINYAGHVLNLRTVEGWYSANGTIVSNCACTLEPVYSRRTALPGRAQEFRDLWKAEIEGKYSGKDALNAWRRLLAARKREEKFDPFDFDLEAV